MRGKSVTVQYFEAPAEVFEEREVMRNWMQKAFRVTVSARKTKMPNQALQRTRKKPRASEL